MDEPQESHRTRSKAAPDWTAEESLILVNEISAVESEWGPTLPSFQKWQQIVENCNALDVNRNLNQCKRKWDALLSAYRRAKQGAPPDRSFPAELFAAVNLCVSTNGKRNDGSGEAEEEDNEDAPAAAEVEEQVAMETDPDSDPEAQGHVTKLFFETGSKKQRRRMKRQKRGLEMRNPWGYFTSTNAKYEESTSPQEEGKNTNANHEESTSPQEEVKNSNDLVESIPEDISTDTNEQSMATMLWESAMQINTILEGNIADDVDYKLADLKNAEAVEIDFTRRQGDKLIDCLGKISTTLNQLCDLVQKCN